MRERPLRIATAAALIAAAVLPGAATAQENEALCHLTGSGYVRLVVDNDGVIEHLAHEEDLYPAPAEGCPGEAAASPTATATATPDGVYPLPSPTVEDFPVAGPDEEGDEGSQPTGAAATPTPMSTPGASLAPRSSRLSQARPLAAGRLPATGEDVWLVWLCGLGLVTAGVGLRLRLR